MEIGSREAIRGAVIHGLGISYVSEAEFVPDDTKQTRALEKILSD